MFIFTNTSHTLIVDIEAVINGARRALDDAVRAGGGGTRGVPADVVVVTHTFVLADERLRLRSDEMSLLACINRAPPPSLLCAHLAHRASLIAPQLHFFHVSSWRQLIRMMICVLL